MDISSNLQYILYDHRMNTVFVPLRIYVSETSQKNQSFIIFRYLNKIL